MYNIEYILNALIVAWNLLEDMFRNDINILKTFWIEFIGFMEFIGNLMSRFGRNIYISQKNSCGNFLTLFNISEIVI